MTISWYALTSNRTARCSGWSRRDGKPAGCGGASHPQHGAHGWFSARSWHPRIRPPDLDAGPESPSDLGWRPGAFFPTSSAALVAAGIADPSPVLASPRTPGRARAHVHSGRRTREVVARQPAAPLARSCASRGGALRGCIARRMRYVLRARPRRDEGSWDDAYALRARARSDG